MSSVGSVGGPGADPRAIADALRASARGATEPQPEESGGFGTALTNALDGVGQAQRLADEAAKAAVTGDLQSVAEYMVASTEAQLATQITVAVRNRAIESFNEIMRMQI